MKSPNIVVIGNGVAGMSAAAKARELSPDATITIVSEETDHFISRTALMWVVCGQLSHQCIEPHERDHYERFGFKRVRARAVGIEALPRAAGFRDGDDEKGGVLKLSNGTTLPFDRLLIACGSIPRRGPWPGSDLTGVGHFVTMQDLEWLENELHGGPSHGGPPPRADHHLKDTTDDSPYRRRALARATRGGPPKHPAVIGGGLIGIEAVEVFHAAGLHPRFFIREDWFWPMAIDRAESTWISERMREGGVDVRLAENVESLEGDGLLSRIKTDKGEYEQDLCVIAIGVVPNTAWLKDSGVEIDGRGGIVVDSAQRTNLQGVYAAGDCASVEWFNGRRMPQQLWYTGRDQGRIAGANMVGEAKSYARGTWYNSAKLFDIEYTTAGLVNMKQPDESEWFYEERGEVRSTTRVVLSGDKVIGFNMLGRRWDHEVLIRFIEEERDLAYVLDHLNEANFDTEFVPPLQIPAKGRVATKTASAEAAE